MSGSCGLEESYFSCSVHTFGDGLRSRLGRQDSDEDAFFTISGCNTPSLETGPAVSDEVPASPSVNQHADGHGKLRPDKSKSGMFVTELVCEDAPKTSASSDSIERSRPITIEYVAHKSVALIEPVSARGDLAEAYFPMHEKDGDTQPLYQPHRFGRDVERARQRSIDEAASSVAATEARASVSSSAKSASYAVQRARPVPALDVPVATSSAAAAPPPARQTAAAWRARTAPIIDAYNPTGIPGSTASLGKYYPTNYNKSSGAAGSATLAPPAAPERTVSLSAADREHQLRQYKLDIISQTTQIARETLGRRAQSAACVAGVETALDERTRKSVALFGRYKPTSPRIAPLLSPGPVTPMALDGNGEGADYLSVRSHTDPPPAV